MRLGHYMHRSLFPGDVVVRYVDRMSVEDLCQQYPEMADQNLVHVDIIADGEMLDGIEDGSQDFVIANHFFGALSESNSDY